MGLKDGSIQVCKNTKETRILNTVERVVQLTNKCMFSFEQALETEVAVEQQESG